MHYTAMANAAAFFATYAPGVPVPGGEDAPVIVEIGSQDVNGSLREVAPAGWQYVGVDFVAGKGVDVVLDDPYQLPFEDGVADMVVSSSCFEHSEMFWIVFLEIMRVLKPHGLFYLNVPSNGAFHRYPVDCWRFYPDSGRALARWGQQFQMDVALLESFTSAQVQEDWNDFVAVFLRDASHAAAYPQRIIDGRDDVTNALRLGSDEIERREERPEDQRRLRAIERALRIPAAGA